MTDVDRHRERLERLLDVAVFAPIGLAVTAREHLPELVSTGRQRVEQRVMVARFIGQMVVEQGRKELERRRTTPAPAAPGPAAATAGPTPTPATDATAVDDGPVPDVASLAISDYESLAASQVVARLAGLTPAELDAVERFEANHRNRRTVLGRIGQLRAAT